MKGGGGICLLFDQPPGIGQRSTAPTAHTHIRFFLVSKLVNGQAIRKKEAKEEWWGSEGGVDRFGCFALLCFRGKYKTI